MVKLHEQDEVNVFFLFLKKIGINGDDNGVF